MHLYSKDDWQKIPWPETEEGRWQRFFFEEMLKEGVTAHISNVQSTLYLLFLDDLLIPLSVNDKEYENSYVCSMYSYLLYAEEEMERHRKFLLSFLLSPLMFVLKFFFKLSRVNRIVSVNNHFLSTNLYGALSSSQVSRICTFLQQRFPTHSILFRSLNSFTEAPLIQALKGMGCDFITTRSVYFFDPERYFSLPSKKRWIFQKDKKLQENSKFQILKHEDFRLEDALEVKRLYDLLYLEKYSSYNPAFTISFFEQVILQKTCTLTGIKYEGRLVGVIGFFTKKGIMATPIVGYDTKAPEELGLYRLLTACVLDESLSQGLLFHMSAGAAHFKRQRGAFQELETMGVLCSHLPFHRVFLWKVLGVLFNTVGAKILVKHKL